MRLPLLIAALGLAAPAAAQPAPAPQLPPEIASGAIVDQLQPVFQAVARALLDMPVGEIEAAVENRPVTRADRQRTVRDVAGIDEGELNREIADSGQVMKAGTQAMVRTLPAITRALNEAGEQIARAMNNLPSPTYPRR